MLATDAVPYARTCGPPVCSPYSILCCTTSCRRTRLTCWLSLQPCSAGMTLWWRVPEMWPVKQPGPRPGLKCGMLLAGVSIQLWGHHEKDECPLLHLVWIQAWEHITNSNTSECQNSAKEKRLPHSPLLSLPCFAFCFASTAALTARFDAEKGKNQA